MKRIGFFLFLISFVFPLVGCGRSTQEGTRTNENTNTEMNPAPTTNTTTNAQEDIIYGTNQESAFVEASRQDCESKGGTFNTCGSPCLDESGFCAQVCALRCEF